MLAAGKLLGAGHARVREVSRVRPGISVASHGEIGIGACARHARHGAAVAVSRGWTDLGCLLEAQRSEVLARASPEGLPALRGVDLAQAHRHRLLIAPCFECVAVGDGDHEAEEGGGQFEDLDRRS